MFVAPRDKIERELMTLWSSMLGIAEVGIDDDFFELGGQSLVAVRLFQRMGKHYGVELSLATLFQAPTIAECAALIRERLGVVSPNAASGVECAAVSVLASKSLVIVQRGTDGTPIFIVHGAGGNVLNFRDLARAMSPSQPVYGLQAAGVDGVTRPHETIEAMAEAYLAEVRGVKPHGPYVFAGYSGGGIIAFEIARRVTAAGEPAPLLVFIDTFHPQAPLDRNGVLSRLNRLRRVGVPYLRGVLERKRERSQRARDDKIIDAHLAAGEPIPFALRGRHLIRNFERAARRYRPQPWKGHATLYRVKDPEYFVHTSGPTYGWDREVLGGVTVVDVPGDHDTVLRGANVQRVASSISTLIERAASAAESY
jgi:thioesterase domain-containing protein/acyl carrier protein